MGLFDFIFGKRKTVKPESKNVRPPLETTEVIPGLVVPKAFALHWPEIEKTKRQCISVRAKREDNLTLGESKFGHFPVLPWGFDYPRDANGDFMFPLAQINWKDVPALEGYPEHGYLQIYISSGMDLYGIDFDHPDNQKNFRVLFFDEINPENVMTDFSFLDAVISKGYLPLEKPHALTFSLKEEYIGIGDVRYEENSGFKLDEIGVQFPEISDDLEDAAYDLFLCHGHKIGGYAYFTQTDPRSFDDRYKDYILLLQIDTDKEIMWGDAGVANFFIHPDDLAKKDFSKVMYNWDCG